MTGDWLLWPVTRCQTPDTNPVAQWGWNITSLKSFPPGCLYPQFPASFQRIRTLTTFENCVLSQGCGWRHRNGCSWWMNSQTVWNKQRKTVKVGGILQKSLSSAQSRHKPQTISACPGTQPAPATLIPQRWDQNNCSHSITLISQIGVRRNG